MSVSINTLRSGDTIYDCHRHKMGNTTMSVMGVWRIHVKEVDLIDRKVLISWNSNPEKWVNERYFQSSEIRRFPPEWSARDMSGYSCYMCNAKKADGHRPNCRHPKAKNLKK